jgi:hypothetical protein
MPYIVAVRIISAASLLKRKGLEDLAHLFLTKWLEKLYHSKHHHEQEVAKEAVFITQHR